jgi:Uma2 family endonuclease
MATVIIEGEVRIPGWVVDLPSFRGWCGSDEFPEEGRIDYIKGEVWVDRGGEYLFGHNPARTEFTTVLGSLVKRERLGRYFTDGLRLRNRDADLLVVPDGLFVSAEGFRERARISEARRRGYVEVEGTPDMVLEVVSDGSEQRTKRLRALYREAGVREYWLVDVRGERLRFDVFRHAATGYAAVRKRDGWVRSAVLGKSFRLTRQADEFGHPEYTLDVR